MTFTEANTVRDFIANVATEAEISFKAGKDLPRTASAVMLADPLRDALIRLNPEIADKPDRADQVMYELNKIIDGVRHGSVVRQNEVFMAWVRGEHSMPFGKDGAHTTVVSSGRCK